MQIYDAMENELLKIPHYNNNTPNFRWQQRN